MVIKKYNMYIFLYSFIVFLLSILTSNNYRHRHRMNTSIRHQPMNDGYHEL
jgi:hypothetical protein